MMESRVFEHDKFIGEIIFSLDPQGKGYGGQGSKIQISKLSENSISNMRFSDMKNSVMLLVLSHNFIVMRYKVQKTQSRKFLSFEHDTNILFYMALSVYSTTLFYE